MSSSKKEEENQNFEKMDTLEPDGHNLKNENILEMIDIVGLLLKRMDSKTLKPCLMVSKLWNKEGMKAFLKNHFIQVPLDLCLLSDLDIEDELQEGEILQEEIDLLETDLIEDVKNSIPFLKVMKIPNLVIKKPDDIQIFQRLSILEQVGKVQLNRKAMTRQQYLECMRKIVKSCPKLTFLGMERFSDYNYEYDEELIKLCVDLEKKGPLMISDLFMSICWEMDDIQATRKFVNSGIGIINLELITYLDDLKEENVFINTSISNFVQKLLESSRNCLRKLKLNTSDDTWFSIPNLPVSRQLETLDMEINATITVPQITMLFPPNFQFKTNCPNLKSFNLHVDPQGNKKPNINYLNQIFATTGSAPSVKSLDFHCYHPLKLDKLFQTFNQIEKLYMSYETDFIIRPLWKCCTSLKTLKLCLDRPDEFTYIGLLSQLTGHCLDFVEQLWFSLEEIKDEIPYPFYPSIVELQALETLTIFGGSFEGLNVKFNDLSQQLALCQMKKLKKIEIETSWRF